MSCLAQCMKPRRECMKYYVFHYLSLHFLLESFLCRIYVNIFISFAHIQIID